MLPKKKRWMLSAEHNSSIGVNMSQNPIPLNSFPHPCTIPVSNHDLSTSTRLADIKFSASKANNTTCQPHSNITPDMLQSGLLSQVFSSEYLTKLGLSKAIYQPVSFSLPAQQQLNHRPNTVPSTNGLNVQTPKLFPKYTTAFNYPQSSTSQVHTNSLSNSTRRLSGSFDPVQRPPKVSNHFSPQLDFSTISAVARAASMLSPSQLEAAAALLSQWDNTNQLVMLTNNNNNRTTVHTNSGDKNGRHYNHESVAISSPKQPSCSTWPNSMPDVQGHCSDTFIDTKPHKFVEAQPHLRQQLPSIDVRQPSVTNHFFCPTLSTKIQSPVNKTPNFSDHQTFQDSPTMKSNAPTISPTLSRSNVKTEEPDKLTNERYFARSHPISPKHVPNSTHHVMPLKKRLIKRYEADHSLFGLGAVVGSVLNRETGGGPHLGESVKKEEAADQCEYKSSNGLADERKQTEKLKIFTKVGKPQKKSKYDKEEEAEAEVEAEEEDDSCSTAKLDSRRKMPFDVDKSDSNMKNRSASKRMTTGTGATVIPASNSKRRSRKHSSSTSSQEGVVGGRRRSNFNRRMAALNGNILMMVTARAQRSTSSGSNRTSPSHSSFGLGESETEQCLSSSSSCDSPKKSQKLSSHCHRNSFSAVDLSAVTNGVVDATESSQNCGGGGGSLKKSKRAAALAASAANAVSNKRPRFGSSRRRTVLAKDADECDAKPKGSTNGHDAEDQCGVDGVDASRSKMIDRIGRITFIKSYELSCAIVMEDALSLEKILGQLSKPPDIQRLTNKSLHLAHSLKFYKRTQRSFVQLIACTHPGLKQVPPCRACRQSKVTNGSWKKHKTTPNGTKDRLADDAVQEFDWSKQSGADRLRKNGAIKRNQFKRPLDRSSTAVAKRSELKKAGKKSTKNGLSTLSSSTCSLSSSSSSCSSSSCSSSSSLVSSTASIQLSTNEPVSVFCRFWGFRKLCFNQRGVLKSSDFCYSNEADWMDMSLWEIHKPVSPPLSLHAACQIVKCTGSLICSLLCHELDILNSVNTTHPSTSENKQHKNGLNHSLILSSSLSNPMQSGNVRWKRPVKGVREMCDVCDTTMFNTHWVCPKCGYSVCNECVRIARDNHVLTDPNHVSTNYKVNQRMKVGRGRNGGPLGWATCTTTRQQHDPHKLLLTVLLPFCLIGKLMYRLHRLAIHYDIDLGCSCPLSAYLASVQNQPQSDTKIRPYHQSAVVNQNSLNLLADLALKTDDTSNSNDLEEESDTNMIRSWITNQYSKMTSAVVGVDRWKYRVLNLLRPDEPKNVVCFQSEWQKNHPVVISGCQTQFNTKLWSPPSFANEFGQIRSTLIDCATGSEIAHCLLCTFWDGFECKSARMVGKNGQPLCLKLKDWPNTDDFAEIHPKRFHNLMATFPLSDYTSRDGQFNLASRLSTFFVRPDLGPKFYVAYGTIGTDSISTTNLHMDIADAVNLMLYVGQPSDVVKDIVSNAESIIELLENSWIDPDVLNRIRRWLERFQAHHSETAKFEHKDYDWMADVPGALWHIFLPEDAAALRTFLNRWNGEKLDKPLEPGSDPIHDQLMYLDQTLLNQLYMKTGIQPCTIVQFHGDSVFIPTGAAHQVRNLNSCIKSALDFVSPEHVGHCFQFIDEFRKLSTTHENHEDKLQVKNMLFHSVKDSLSVLISHAATHS